MPNTARWSIGKKMNRKAIAAVMGLQLAMAIGALHTPVRAELTVETHDLLEFKYQQVGASEEEAVLRLKLTIDERGRVIAVEPLGRADRAFLDSARRHLIAHWRYRPATEDGRAVSSSAVITLRFQLDG